MGVRGRGDISPKRRVSTKKIRSKKVKKFLLFLVDLHLPQGLLYRCFKKEEQKNDDYRKKRNEHLRPR